MRDAISIFLRNLAGLRTPRTIKTYEYILDEFADFLAARGVATPARSDVDAFLARPRRDGAVRAASSRNQALAAIRVFAGYALREGLLASNPTQGVPFGREPRREPTFLTVAELRRLFRIAAAEATNGQRERDLALLALLTQAGLRVAELVSLDLENVDLSSFLLAGVVGKGGTMRTIPLGEETARILEAWLTIRPGMAAPDEVAFLVGRHGQRMSVRSVERLFERWRKAMGTVRIHPHLMRHSFITNGVALGADIVSMQHLAGHESIRSTERYAHVVDGRRLDAVRRLSVAIPPDLVPPRPLPDVVEGAAVDVACPKPQVPPANPLDVEERFDDARACDPRRPPLPVPARRAPHRRLAQATDGAGRRVSATVCTPVFGACMRVGVTCSALPVLGAGEPTRPFPRRRS